MPALGDRISVLIDAYDGKVLSLSESAGIEPDEPASNVIPVDEARTVALRALDRIEDSRTRERIKRDWARTPPTASQVYSRIGGTLGQYTDPVVATWPLKMRLQWVFSGSGGEAVIDAETGAVIFVGYSMGGGSQRPAAKGSPEASRPVREGTQASDGSAGIPWLWGFAAIPLAVGAWLILRARG